MRSSYFKSLKLFSFKEKANILIYSLASRLLNKTNKNTNRSFEVIKSLPDNFELSSKNGMVSTTWNKSTISFKKNSSDLSVFKQIIIDEEYKSVLSLIEKNQIQINSILDAGANIGLSTIYLNHFLKPKHIVCLEPSPTTFLRLKNNISKNQIDAKLIQAGIWKKNSTLFPNFDFRDGEDWSFSLAPKENSNQNGIEVFSMENILKNAKLNSFDFVKIDIEGGEKELFEDKRLGSTLTNTKVITIEIHDELNCREKIEQDLINFGFELFHSGELTIGINKTYLL